MLMSTNDEIDKLFSSGLENHQISASQDEWAKLHSDLKWVNFWKLQFYSFNIFYLIGIVGIITLLLSVLFVNHGTTMQDTKPFQDSIQKTDKEPKDTVINLPDSIFEQKENYIPVKKNTEYKKQVITVVNKADSDPLVKAEEKHLPPLDTVPNSMRIGSAANPENDLHGNVDTIQVETKVRKIKRTKVVKSEAVIVRDTVDINKKEK
jgi:hypothetical protein